MLRNLVSAVLFLIIFNLNVANAGLDLVYDTCTGTNDDCTYDDGSVWYAVAEGTIHSISEQYLAFNKSLTINENYRRACRKKSHLFPDIDYGRIYAQKNCNKKISGIVGDLPSTSAPPENKSNCKSGSVIDVDNQILQENIPVSGTNFSLNYSSDRTGSYGPSSSVKFTVQDINTPSIDEVHVKIAGQLFTYDYSTLTPGQVLSVAWDGKDDQGNDVDGTEAIIEYVVTGSEAKEKSSSKNLSYSNHIYSVSTNYRGSIAGMSDIPIGSNQVTLTSFSTVGWWKSKSLGLGGWTPSNIAFYSKSLKRIYYGRGAYRTVDEQVGIIDSNGKLIKGTSGTGTNVYFVAEADEKRVLIFDQTNGRHLYTMSSYTGKILETFNYDSNGKLTSIVDGFGKTTTITRPSSTSVVITAPFGQVTTLTLDSNEDVTQVDLIGSKTYTMTYDSGGNEQLLTFTKPSGSVATFTYDSDGLLASDSNTSGSSWSIVDDYESNGIDRNITMTSAEGIISDFDIKVGLNGQSVRTEYFPSGNSEKTTSETDGSVTINKADGGYFYGKSGSDPRFSKNQRFNYAETIRSYTAQNQLSISRSKQASYSTSDYLVPTSETFTTTVNGDASTRVYDGSTKKFTYTTPEGRVRTQTIGDYNNITESKYASYTPVTYAYTTNGLLESITQGARQTQFSYNTSGYLDEIEDALGKSTSFEYYAGGELKKQIFHDLREINFSYDSAGRLASITPPSRPAHGFLQNLFDKISSYIAPVIPGLSDTTTSYVYDDDGRLTQVNMPGSLTKSYSYNGTTGLLSQITTPEGNHSLTYTTKDQLDTISSPDSVTLNFDYDSELIDQKVQTSSNMVATIDNSHSEYLMTGSDLDINDTLNSQTLSSDITYSYDDDRLLTSAGNLTITRDTNTAQITGTTLDDVTESFTYDTSFGELASYTAKFQSTTIYSEVYTRDYLGRITQKVVTQGGVTKTIDYVYDDTGRLYEVYENSTLYHRYIYDNNSNRTGRVKLVGGVEVTESATFDDQDRILTFENTTYTHTNGGNRSSSVTSGGDTFNTTYETMGALKTLTHIHSGGTDNYTFKNDSSGNRIEVVKNSTTQTRYVYNSKNQVIAEIQANGDFVHYVYGTQAHSPDYIVKNGTRYKLVKDQLGSIRLIVNSTTGVIIDSTVYDEFGIKLSSTNPSFISLGFAGGIEDSVSGLVRFGARDYDPQVGKWTTKDPYLFDAGDANLYSYVSNDPVNKVDPSGEIGRSINSRMSDFIRDVIDFKRRFEELKEYLDDFINKNLCRINPKQCGKDKDPIPDPNDFYPEEDNNGSDPKSSCELPKLK